MLLQQEGLTRTSHPLRQGWTVHGWHDSRLYYCNHLTRTCSWVPPSDAWQSDFPYGWEEAEDHDGKPYYINHVNKTTTYLDPRKEEEEAPLPREVTLTRHPHIGFGFVAGSERPVIVRYVTDGGPSEDLLLPGDQILGINGEDVKLAPRDHVISLVRACSAAVRLTVCQPTLDSSARRSALLSAAKKAKLRCHPPRVRFAEGVVVNGAPLFPAAGGDSSSHVLPNVLKVYLENGQTKSFKYNSGTLVRDVVASLQSKLCIAASEHFALVVESLRTLRRNKLTLLDPDEPVARVAARPGSHSLRCLFRLAFVPRDASQLAQRDPAALDYLFLQCCNDVVQERYAPELKYDVSLRLAALHIHQHALAHNLAGKLTVKAVEREFGLEKFVPVSLMSSMKRKELRKLLGHFLKLQGPPGPRGLSGLQAKLQYLRVVGELPSYGTKCFATNPGDAELETVLLVSPRFGISHIKGVRNGLPVGLATLEELQCVVVRREDAVSRSVSVLLPERQHLTFSLEDRDAQELVLVLQGYHRMLTGRELPVDEERGEEGEDLAPNYFSPHSVRPAPWSYAPPLGPAPRIVNFAAAPPYVDVEREIKTENASIVNSTPMTNGTKGVDGNMNVDPLGSEFPVPSVLSMEISQHRRANHATDESYVLRRVAEMQDLVLTSEQYLEEQEGAEPRPQLQRMPCDVSEGAHDGEEAPHLPHSDSLLLLNQAASPDSLCSAVLDLNLDAAPSESDTDSASTPLSSPSRRLNASSPLQSFGLHSPDALDADSLDIQSYLKKLQRDSALHLDLGEGALYLDPDIIDLTAIPPPQTPDDGVLSLAAPPSLPPTPFADLEEGGLDAFLASVEVAPPAPAQEVTPEEILSYIIPPPPKESTPMVTCAKDGLERCCDQSRDCQGWLHPGITNPVVQEQWRREEVLRRSDAALAVLLVRLDQIAAQPDGSEQDSQSHSQEAHDALVSESCELVSCCKAVVLRLTAAAADDLADSSAACLQRLRRLAELCGGLRGPPQRDLVLRIHDVAGAVRDVLRRPEASAHLAAALTELLRTLRLFQ